MFEWLISHSPLFYFTQSLWRDEAFSIFVSERPILFFISKLTFEPPLHYVLLHFWIKLFGESEIAVRSLSFAAFALATVVVIIWSEKLFKKHFLSWFLPLFFFFNPMLLYYAFEVRAYAWYVLFTVLSMYTYFQKAWVWYIAASIAGFYTHTYFIFVPFVQAIHWFVTTQWGRKHMTIQSLLGKPIVRSLLVIGLGITPWLIKILMEASKLKNSWYFPVNLNLIKSVLGNMFLGYEGTPWFLWKYTAYLSAFLLALFFIALRNKGARNRNLFFFLMAILPLAVVIGISFVKPLFVNRYLIPVSVSEVFLVAFAIEAIKSKFLQYVVAFGFLLPVLWFNGWYPQEHPKLNIRATIMQVNTLKNTGDVIFADNPLIFFETIYYSSDRTRVFLYNPNGSPFPWYVGDIIVSRGQMARDLPSYPTRAYLVHADGTFDIAYRATSVFATSTKKRAP